MLFEFNFTFQAYYKHIDDDDYDLNFSTGLKDALEQKKPELISKLEVCEKRKIPPIEKAIDEVHDMSARLHARTVAVKQALRSCAEECVQRIELKCEEMLEGIENLYLSKNNVLQTQKSKLEMSLNKSITARDFVDYAFKHGNEAEIFQLYEVCVPSVFLY